MEMEEAVLASCIPALCSFKFATSVETFLYAQIHSISLLITFVEDHSYFSQLLSNLVVDVSF